MQKSLFREEALERIASPDELDRLMPVTSPKGWLALIALLALVMAALLWGVFGRIPIQVNADSGRPARRRRPSPKRCPKPRGS